MTPYFPRPFAPLLAGVLFVFPAHATEVQLSFELDEPAVPCTGVVRASAVAGANLDEEAVPLEFPAEIPGEKRLDIDPQKAWTLTLESEECWSPGALVAPGQNLAKLTVLPTGRVQGRLRVPLDEALEAGLTARFQSSAQRTAESEEKTLEGEIACDVDAAEEAAAGTAAWECRVPAAKVDLRLRAEGFVSHYLWDVEISATEPRDAGLLELERGASVVGWVMTEDDHDLSRETRVELRPRTAPGASTEVTDQMSLTALAEKPDTRGFVHFRGVAPGAYAVSAVAPGYSPEERTPVVVDSGSETALEEPLVLQRPLTVEFRLLPPVDPAGDAWQLELFDAGEMSVLERGEPGEEGVWRLADQSSGRYALAVLDSEDRRILFEEVEIGPEKTVLDVEVPVVEVDGSLTLGGEPLSATLYFGAFSGVVSITMESDEEGQFSGWVPGEGEWRVDVRGEKPRVFRRLQGVEIVPEDDGVARPAIDLPDMTISGELIDEEGEPVPRTTVAIIHLEKRMPTFTRSDAEGKFVAHGQEAGTFWLEAKKTTTKGEHLSSETVEVVIDEDHPHATVEIVLRPIAELTGRVLFGGTPIPGARVSLDDQRTESGRAAMMSFGSDTDYDGRFAFELQAGVSEAVVVVMAPGFTLQRKAWRRALGYDVTISLDRNGGELAIATGGKVGGIDGVKMSVKRDGATRYASSELAQWARMNGAGEGEGWLTVPHMPVGSYEVCWLELGNRPCVEGFLAPGQRLELAREPTGIGFRPE